MELEGAIFLADPAELGRDGADESADFLVEPADVGLELIPTLSRFLALKKPRAESVRAELGLEPVRADGGKDESALGVSAPATPAPITLIVGADSLLDIVCAI